MAVRWLTHCREGDILAEWIASDNELADAAADFSPCIALDTEFVRTNTYYPTPGLYQVSTAERVFLIDPLSIEDWQPFVDVLLDPQVTKVMHACLEDSEMIFHHLGVRMQGVFDTQFAHAFVSPDFSLSYARLVEHRLDVLLGKHETRSDWLQRPLTPEQIEYAVEDVQYLIPLYQDLSDELNAEGKLDWFVEDMSKRERYEPVEPLEYYKNLKKAWRFSAAELSRLQALCAWRERTAQNENVPRNRVVWDDHLFQFARRSTLKQADLQATLPRVVARRYGDDLMGLFEEFDEPTEGNAPEPLQQPLSSRQGALVKKMRSRGLAVAEEVVVAPELLCRKKDLEECVRHFVDAGELPELFRSWREDLVGGVYRDVLKGAGYG